MMMTQKTIQQVPFRLTRDVVDGMGCTGCEGVFRRCCEETIRVLRGHVQTETILTILEVFIADPLYRWTQTKPELLRRQERNAKKSEQTNEEGAQQSEGNDEKARQDALSLMSLLATMQNQPPQKSPATSYE